MHVKNVCLRKKVRTKCLISLLGLDFAALISRESPRDKKSKKKKDKAKVKDKPKKESELPPVASGKQANIDNVMSLIKGGFKSKLNKIDRQDSLQKSGRRGVQPKQEANVSELYNHLLII